MFVKDYFKSKPESFDENDVFVCESRYSAKAKAFKKIKVTEIMLFFFVTLGSYDGSIHGSVSHAV